MITLSTYGVTPLRPVVASIRALAGVPAQSDTSLLTYQQRLFERQNWITRIIIIESHDFCTEYYYSVLRGCCRIWESLALT